MSAPANAPPGAALKALPRPALTQHQLPRVITASSRTQPPFLPRCIPPLAGAENGGRRRHDAQTARLRRSIAQLLEPGAL